MLGEKATVMCVFLGTNHTFKEQTEVFEGVNKFSLSMPLPLLVAFVLTSNLMLVYGFYKTSRPFTIITKLFIYLSLVDIIVTTLPVLYATLTMADLLTCWTVFLLFGVMQSVFLLGISIVATISFLRYWSIKKPLDSIDAGRLVVVLIIQAIMCGIIGAVLFSFFYLRVSSEQMIELNNTVPITQFLAVSFVLSVNILSYRKLKSMKKMSGFSADNVENISNQRQKTMSEANICLLYISAFYFLGPIPLFIVFMFLERLLLSSWGFYLFILAYMFYLSNGGINSLIVIMRTKNLRKFYKKKFCFSKINKSP